MIRIAEHDHKGGCFLKKAILVILTVLLAAMIALAVFWDPIMDLLPIDQSGWDIQNEVHYYLDEKGDPLTGWQEINGCRYYFAPESGAMQTGWIELDADRYYFDADGRMLSSCWLQDGNGNYYLNADGTMSTGWTELEGRRYYFHQDGTLASGWLDLDDGRYYLSEDGSAVSGWLTLNAQTYYLDENGRVHYGWLELDGKRYYLNEEGVMAAGWLQLENGLFYLNEDGTAASGWVEIEGARFYIGENGRCGEGWQEIDGKRYYLNSDGSCQTGWLELDGNTYYLKEDGSAATGKLVIDEVTYYFTSTGANIILVNPWNYIPDDYEVELVELDSGKKVAAEMYDALMRMLADCEAAGYKAYVRSAYRTHADQQANFNRILEKYNYDRTKAAMVVAIPGTSEHQLGLAVDITDNSYRDLDYGQEKTATQQWLMEHCWEYGFILRYPSEKSAITGIIYEPWHYRYVGTELSMELKDSGLCLEEYLDQLTEA